MNYVMSLIENCEVLNNGAKYSVAINKVVNISENDYTTNDLARYDNDTKILTEFLSDIDCAYLRDIIIKLVNTDSGGLLIKIKDEDLSRDEYIYLLLTFRSVSISSKYSNVIGIVLTDFINFCKYLEKSYGWF